MSARERGGEENPFSRAAAQLGSPPSHAKAFFASGAPGIHSRRRTPGGSGLPPLSVPQESASYRSSASSLGPPREDGFSPLVGQAGVALLRRGLSPVEPPSVAATPRPTVPQGVPEAVREASEETAREDTALSPHSLASAGTELLAAVVSDGFPRQYRLGRCVGQGSYGEVFKALNVGTGEVFAVKRVRLPEPLRSPSSAAARADRVPELVRAISSSAGDEEQPLPPLLESIIRGSADVAEEVRELVREVDVMRRLHHRHIVTYLGARTSEEGHYLDVFMEFVPGGTLAGMIREFGALEETLCAAYTRQILLGLEYLHRHDIVHRCGINDPFLPLSLSLFLPSPSFVLSGTCLAGTSSLETSW